jgi:SAM-dependent methyltransferase
MINKGLLEVKTSSFDRLLVKFPLTYWGILCRMVGTDFKTILDVGCGNGDPMSVINRDHTFQATGVDIYAPYLQVCKKRGVYSNLVRSDIRDLPFKDKSFDTVICFHVIEHLTKKEGLFLIKKLETIARKRVVLAMPLGDLPQEEYDGNKHQEHKSEWYPSEFKKMGYKVVGQGLMAIYRNENVVEKYGWLSNIIFVFSILFQPLLLIKPELARYIICRKDLDKK